MEKDWKNKGFFSSLKNSLNGIKNAVKTERNLKIQIVIALIVIIFVFVLKISIVKALFVYMSIFFVIVTEMINTAIEKTVDLITEEYNEKAKVIKDIAAGAVLISAINSVVIGILVFGSKIIDIIL